jgi:hypothetical protein
MNRRNDMKRNKQIVTVMLILAAVLMSATGLLAAETKQAPAAPDRTVLPIQVPEYPYETELDARKATPPARFEVKAPAGAPNVLIVLIDDMGFGMPSAFGGPIHMPTVDRLAGGGRHAVHLGQAGRIELRRNAERHGCPLAEGGQAEGRGALAVASCDRRGAEGARSRAPARAEGRERHAANTDPGREHDILLQ